MRRRNFLAGVGAAFAAVAAPVATAVAGAQAKPEPKKRKILFGKGTKREKMLTIVEGEEAATVTLPAVREAGATFRFTNKDGKQVTLISDGMGWTELNGTVKDWTRCRGWNNCYNGDDSMLKTLFALLLEGEELRFKKIRDDKVCVVTICCRGRWHVQHAWTSFEIDSYKSDEIPILTLKSKLRACRQKASDAGFYTQEEVDAV